MNTIQITEAKLATRILHCGYIPEDTPVHTDLFLVFFEILGRFFSCFSVFWESFLREAF